MTSEEMTPVQFEKRQYQLRHEYMNREQGAQDGYGNTHQAPVTSEPSTGDGEQREYRLPPSFAIGRAQCSHEGDIYGVACEAQDCQRKNLNDGNNGMPLSTQDDGDELSVAYEQHHAYGYCREEQYLDTVKIDDAQAGRLFLPR